MSSVECRYCKSAADDDGNRICDVCFMAEASDDPLACSVRDCPVPAWNCGPNEESLCAGHAAKRGYCYACGRKRDLTPTVKGSLCRLCFWLVDRKEAARAR